MSSSKQQQLKNSSHSLSSQVSFISSQVPTAATSTQGVKQRKGDSSPPIMAEGGPGNLQLQPQPCSLAIPITSSFSKPANKQGFRFSLRRMLYNSPLVSQRRARSLSSGNNLSSQTTAGTSGSDSKKKQSPSLCK